MAGDRSSLGAQGEPHARRFLEAKGLAFRAANWRCSAGELDLVMIDRAEVVFVEVKTRRGERSGRAEEAVSLSQGRRILAAADWFLSEHVDLAESIWRVDLVAITLDPSGAVRRIVHIDNAIVAS